MARASRRGRKDAKPPREKPSRTHGPGEGGEATDAAAGSGGSPAPDRGVYMISVAAELAGMHPQTLRIYEARGLITPKRSPKKTRLYSQEDVERLRRIQELTSDFGMNLAGVERVFQLEGEMERMERRMARLEKLAERVEKQLQEELERVHRSYRRELVLYQPPEQALAPKGTRPDAVRVRVSRPRRHG
jgi:MerR family transcriptional regulator/heat shock protein HspR